MADPRGAGSPEKIPWRALVIVGLVAGAVALSLWVPAGTFFSGQPDGYYGWQTEAYLAGQLRLKVEPHPAMLALENPYSTANAPYYIRDLSLYRGHYYSYYGVAPIVIFFAPARILTGWYPTEATVSIACALVCCAATLALLSGARRRYAPDTPPLLRAAFVLMAIFGSGTLCLIAEIGTNQLAALSADCWLALMLWAGFRALHEARPRRWLAFASLAWGMTVASKPSFLFTGAALLPCGWAAWRGAGRDRRKPWPWLASMLGPAAAIGVGLAWLNYARFDSPFEFGMRFTLSHLGDIREKAFFSPCYAPENFRVYLGNLPGFSAYFPYLTVGWREPVGLVCLPFCLGAAGLWAWLRGNRDPSAEPDAPPAERPPRVLALASVLAALGNTGPLIVFCVNWSRYWLDLVMPWTLAASLGWLALSAAAPARLRPIVARLCFATAVVNIVMLSAVFFETLY